MSAPLPSKAYRCLSAPEWISGGYAAAPNAPDSVLPAIRALHIADPEETHGGVPLLHATARMLAAWLTASSPGRAAVAAEAVFDQVFAAGADPDRRDAQGNRPEDGLPAWVGRRLNEARNRYRQSKEAEGLLQDFFKEMWGPGNVKGGLHKIQTQHEWAAEGRLHGTLFANVALMAWEDRWRPARLETRGGKSRTLTRRAHAHETISRLKSLVVLAGKIDSPEDYRLALALAQHTAQLGPCEIKRRASEGAQDEAAAREAWGTWQAVLKTKAEPLGVATPEQIWAVLQEAAETLPEYQAVLLTHTLSAQPCLIEDVAAPTLLASASRLLSDPKYFDAHGAHAAAPVLTREALGLGNAVASLGEGFEPAQWLERLGAERATAVVIHAWAQAQVIAFNTAVADNGAQDKETTRQHARQWDLHAQALLALAPEIPALASAFAPRILAWFTNKPTALHLDPRWGQVALEASLPTSPTRTPRSRI